MKVPTYLMCITTLLTGCGPKEEIELREAIRPVRYLRVLSTQGQTVRSFSGLAKAGIESKLSFRINGTIEHIGVKVGDVIEKGHLIARIDPTDYRLKLQQAQAALAQAQAEARNAAANYARVRALYENRNASRNDLDGARATSESSAAAVRSIQNQLDLAQRQLGYTRLTAPARCAVAQVPVETNENITLGQAVATVNCGSRIEVTVAVPEAVIARVKQGHGVQVGFDAIPGIRYAATISEVAISSTGLETTFPVTVTLQDPDDRIRPGMAAEVAFEFADSGGPGRILIPPVAVGEDPAGRYVYTVEAQEHDTGIVHRRPVSIGELTAGGLEITQGLREGDLVVTAGVSRMEEGLQVKLQ